MVPTSSSEFQVGLISNASDSSNFLNTGSELLFGGNTGSVLTGTGGSNVALRNVSLLWADGSGNIVSHPIQACTAPQTCLSSTNSLSSMGGLGQTSPGTNTSFVANSGSLLLLNTVSGEIIPAHQMQVATNPAGEPLTQEHLSSSIGGAHYDNGSSYTMEAANVVSSYGSDRHGKGHHQSHGGKQWSLGKGKGKRGKLGKAGKAVSHYSTPGQNVGGSRYENSRYDIHTSWQPSNPIILQPSAGGDQQVIQTTVIEDGDEGYHFQLSYSSIKVPERIGWALASLFRNNVSACVGYAVVSGVEKFRFFFVRCSVPRR